MVKHTQTIRRQFANFVWTFLGWRLKGYRVNYLDMHRIPNISTHLFVAKFGGIGKAVARDISLSLLFLMRFIFNKILYVSSLNYSEQRGAKWKIDIYLKAAVRSSFSI